jgi:hypothetical protein
MGNFDLKKEMEKLKQLDHEQKLQRRISLKATPNHSISNSPIGASGYHGAESPNKKKVFGEFDETKEEAEEDYSLKGDEMLLSRDNSNKTDAVENNNDEDDYDEEYITTKTGMEDPFPDHIDPNEEQAELSPHKAKLKREAEERRKDEEE